MLLRLDLLADIGRFKSLKHKAPQFSKLSLVYGRNAQGKSTVCAVLSSAFLSDPEIIAARKRLGAKGQPTATLGWAGRALSFSGGKWDARPGAVYLFDQDYVERNVHIAGSVTRDNKRQLLQIIVGQKGVDLARDISKADAEIKAIMGRLGELERLIKTACPVVSDVETFCTYVVPEDIDAQIIRATKGLGLARQAAAVLQRKAPRPFELPLIEAFEGVLASSVAGISQTAAERVAEHIQRHGMEKNGERWIKYGIDHTVTENCPFCTQDIKGMDLVKAFRDFFSETYSEHTRKVETEGQRAKTFREEGPTPIKAILIQNAADLAFWDEVTDLPRVLAISTAETSEIEKGLVALGAAFDAKMASPFSGVAFEADRSQVAYALERLHAYDYEVVACMEAIERARREVKQADAAKAEAVLNGKKALKAKTGAPLSAHVQEFLSLSARRKELNGKKSDLQTELRTYAATMIATRQGEINELLTLFGANFQVVDAKAGFVGREANTEYAIEVGAHILRVGVGSQKEPSFKTVLSAGDKFTLALAFFLSQVHADAELSDAVVVFDDPFSSQDMQRQWETGSQIRQLTRHARQVIVFSHDPRFLYLIEKDADPKDCSTYQLLFESDNEAAIKAWSAEEELKMNYVRQAERIRHLANTGQFLSDTSPDGLIKDLRPFLEDFIKLRFPGRFSAKKMLDVMATEIEAAGGTDPLFKDVAHLRALNEYTRGNHHGGASPPDVTALRAQCRRVVMILGHY
jgi:wobble nucleotide-excising tRNase